MSGIKETIKLNTESTILGLEEGGYSFVRQLKNLPKWKYRLVLGLAIAIIPVYLVARFGTEQYLSMKYARMALSAHASFTASSNPIVGPVKIIRNPNGTFSAVSLVTNPNIDLGATGISYIATFLDSNKKTVSSTTSTIYLLPNEKKYLVFPKIDSGSAQVVSGTVTLAEVKWQKKENLPDIKLRASDPLLYDESNPLTFIAEGSIINDSPYQISSARIVFLLFNDANDIIGVSQRDEFKLLPYGRRAYKQLWPGIYSSQVRKVQVIPVTNLMDAQNVSAQPTSPPNTNLNTNADSF